MGQCTSTAATGVRDEGTTPTMSDMSDVAMDQDMAHDVNMQQDDHHREGGMGAEVSSMQDMDHQGGGDDEMTIDGMENEMEDVVTGSEGGHHEGVSDMGAVAGNPVAGRSEGVPYSLLFDSWEALTTKDTSRAVVQHSTNGELRAAKIDSSSTTHVPVVDWQNNFSGKAVGGYKFNSRGLGKVVGLTDRP